MVHASNPRCLFEKGQKDHFDATPGDRTVTRPTLSSYEPTGGVRVCGYSERGILNALLYEIGFSADSVGVLSGLLSLVRVPGSACDFPGLLGAEVLVEQSLSDFGDADVVLLLHGADWRRVVFIEGKVKPSQAGSWTVHGAWREFLARKDNKLDSSNLFTQLYHKVRFVESLREGGIAKAERGVPFPDCSTKTLRKLGNNPVVRKAAQMIEVYAEEALYIAVVPDSVSNLSDFYGNELRSGPASDVVGWNTNGWGYLTWKQVEDYCQQQGLVNTLRVFDFNRGQIY